MRCVGRLDDEYKSFLAELGGGGGGGGGGPRPSGFSGGPGGGGGPGYGGGYQGDRGPRQRPGDELPDDCKLYVGVHLSVVALNGPAVEGL